MTISWYGCNAYNRAFLFIQKQAHKIVKSEWLERIKRYHLLYSLWSGKKYCLLRLQNDVRNHKLSSMYFPTLVIAITEVRNFTLEGYSEETQRDV